MARIAGINIPMSKHLWVGLTHIYGVGRSRARNLCTAAGIAPTIKVKDLTEVGSTLSARCSRSSPSRVTCDARCP